MWSGDPGPADVSGAVAPDFDVLIARLGGDRCRSDACRYRRPVDLRFGLIDGDPVIAIVDAGDQIAAVNMLVVGHGHIGDIAANLRCDREAPRGDKGVVGGFIVADGEPVGKSADRCKCASVQLT